MNTYIFQGYEVKTTDNLVVRHFETIEEAHNFWFGLRRTINWVSDITNVTITLPVINGKPAFELLNN